MLASPPSVHAPSRGLLIASYLALCSLWGSTYLAIAIALEGFPPFLLGGARFFASGVLLIGFARLRGEAWPTRAHWLGMAVAGLFFFVIGNGLIGMAERSVSSGVAAVLVATMPLWITVIGRLVGEPVSRLEIAGVVLGLVGVGVMNLGSELRGSPAGVAMLLLSPLGWAIGSLISKRMPSPPGMMRAGGQMLAGGLTMGVVALALGERMAAEPSARAIGAALYLMVAGSLIGFTAYSYLLKHTRPVIATSYAYVNPVIAVILGVTIAGESFDLASGVGGVIILAAILLVGLSRNSSKPGPAVTMPVAPSSSQPSTKAASSQPSMSARVSAEIPAVATCQPLASSARP